MDKIRCAVDWVNDEGRGAGEDHAWLVGFFADKGVGWVGCAEFGADHELDCLVGFGYEVCS